MDQPTVQQSSQRIRRSPKYWQGMVDQFEISGLSQRAFCQQAGIAYGTFSRWRRRLLAADVTPPCPAPEAGLFVELPADATPPAASPSWDVELQLGHDVFLRLRHQSC